MNPTIGVFDSGSGGLSILSALRRRLPRAALLYVGDLAYAPYGEREAHEVVARSERVVEHLIERGARVVVVACNTATVLGIHALRARWPQIAFVGVEPGVKPAAATTRNGRIAVMATPATAASERLRFLVEAYAADVQVLVTPCPGLAIAIEHGAGDEAALRAVLAEPCAAIRAFEADTVVLGCTHYPFVASQIQQTLGPEMRLLDTASAVAERVAQVCTNSPPARGDVQVFSTGATEAMNTLLRRCDGISDTTAAALSI